MGSGFQKSNLSQKMPNLPQLAIRWYHMKVRVRKRLDRIFTHLSNLYRSHGDISTGT